ncbi:MAG: hypothetical protein PHS41_11840 [Victivallaceae bacterium]|nr:hypothetical protein [Victivallaceae bacterium]
MNNLYRILLGASILMGGVELSAVENPLKPENWGRQFSTSGKEWKVAVEDKEQAIRFLTAFDDSTKDRWLYPSIALTSEDREADALSFEIRAVQNPEGRGFKNCLVIFLDSKGKQLGGLQFPAPGREYSKVTLKLEDRLKFPLADVAKIRIGVNNRDAQELVMFLRNIHFSKGADAAQ